MRAHARGRIASLPLDEAHDMPRRWRLGRYAMVVESAVHCDRGPRELGLPNVRRFTTRAALHAAMEDARRNAGYVPGSWDEPPHTFPVRVFACRWRRDLRRRIDRAWNADWSYHEQKWAAECAAWEERDAEERDLSPSQAMLDDDEEEERRREEDHRDGYVPRGAGRFDIDDGGDW